MSGSNTEDERATAAERQHVSLVFLLSRRCNLQCHYCNVEAGPSASAAQLSLSDVERWVDAFASLAPTSIDIQLHGGEPLVVEPSVELYAAVARNAAAAHVGSVVRVVGVQTNGLDVTPARLEQLEAARVGVTVSVDGPREVHDKNRVKVNGRPSFDDAMRAVHALRERGGGRTVIAVLDAPENVVPAMEFFMAEGMRLARMNPIRPLGRGLLFGPLREAAFMREMADAYFEVARRVAAHNASHPEAPFYEDNVSTYMRALLEPRGDARSWTFLVDENGELWAHPGVVGAAPFRLVSASEEPREGLRRALGLGDDASPAAQRNAFDALHRRLFGSCETCPTPGYCASYVGFANGASSRSDPLCTFRTTLVERLRGWLREDPEAARRVVSPLAPRRPRDRQPDAVPAALADTASSPAVEEGEEELTARARAALDAVVVDDDGREWVRDYGALASELRKATDDLVTFRQLAGLADDFAEAECAKIADALDALARIGFHRGRRAGRARPVDEDTFHAAPSDA